MPRTETEQRLRRAAGLDDWSPSSEPETRREECFLIAGRAQGAVILGAGTIFGACAVSLLLRIFA